MPTSLFGLALLASLPTTWTVDASGGGDFVDLPAAVAAVNPGDVLMIQPGTYSAFTLTEELTLLGPAAGPRPRITGESRVEGVLRFALGGLDLERLIVEDVPGHGEIDACSFGATGGPAVEVFGCDRLQVERSDLAGGLFAEGSTLTVVESRLRGFDGSAGAGGDGLEVVNCEVQLVKTDLEGGTGSDGSGSACGSGGAALRCVGGNVLFLGNDHLAIAGSGGGGCPPGPAIAASQSAVVDHQGILVLGSTESAGGATIFEGFGYPLMTLVGSDLPGEPRRLQISAVHYNYVLVLGSFRSESTSVPGVTGLVGIDPAGVFFSQVIIGQLLVAPVTIAFQVPVDLISFAGTIVHFQGLASLAPGVFDPNQLAMTNPVALLLRF